MNWIGSYRRRGGGAREGWGGRGRTGVGSPVLTPPSLVDGQLACSATEPPGRSNCVCVCVCARARDPVGRSSCPTWVDPAVCVCVCCGVVLCVCPARVWGAERRGMPREIDGGGGRVVDVRMATGACDVWV